MNEPTTHPVSDRLVEFARGELELGEIEEIRKHLATCDSCCRALEQVPDDPLLVLVRQVRRASDEGVSGAGETSLDSSDQLTIVTSDPLQVPIPVELVDHPRYRILQQIGQGGMGEVYKAEHRLMQRVVALKVINQILVNNQHAIERFRREVQAAASLSHPNIVSAYDAEQAGTVHFLAMEYVEGTDLARMVKERGPLPWEDACRLLRQAALGLDHAHQHGMIHRDIKPHNLMLAKDGTLKILDFGLASLAAEPVGGRATWPLAGGLTTHSTVIGTPDYISPEQADDAHAVDCRTDVYGLGATLYFLLTGQPPFNEASIRQWREGNERYAPLPIGSLRSDLPQGLAEAVGRMMAHDPSDRYDCALDVAHALEPYIGREAGEAEVSGGVLERENRPGLPESRAWISPWAVVVASLLVVALVATVGLLISRNSDSVRNARLSGPSMQPQPSIRPTTSLEPPSSFDKPVSPLPASVSKPPLTEYVTDRTVAKDPVTDPLGEEFVFNFRGKRFDTDIFVPLGINSLYGASLIRPEQRGLRIIVPKAQIAAKPRMGFAPALQILGDFDITAGYEILLPEARQAEPGIGPCLYICSEFTRCGASLRRTEWDGQPTYWFHCRNTDEAGQSSKESKYVLAEGHSGKFRLVRAGSVLHFLAAEAEGEPYFALGMCRFGEDPIELLRLEASATDAHDVIDIVWTDLVIRAEGLKPIAVPVVHEKE